jgi:hypothetical protein
MITEDQIAMAMVKQMKDDIDREVLEKLGVGRPGFTLEPYQGQPCTVTVKYGYKEINHWILDQPRKSWQFIQSNSTTGTKTYILDEQLYTMFLLRWA